jgi:hypothetical protein
VLFDDDASSPAQASNFVYSVPRAGYTEVEVKYDDREENDSDNRPPPIEDSSSDKGNQSGEDASCEGFRMYEFDHGLDIEDEVVHFLVAGDPQLRQLQGEGAVRARHRLQGQSLHLDNIRKMDFLQGSVQDVVNALSMTPGAIDMRMPRAEVDEVLTGGLMVPGGLTPYIHWEVRYTCSTSGGPAETQSRNHWVLDSRDIDEHIHGDHHVACARRREDEIFTSGDGADRQRDEFSYQPVSRYGDPRCSQNSPPGACHLYVLRQCPRGPTAHCGVYCELPWSCPNGSTARHGRKDYRDLGYIHYMSDPRCRRLSTPAPAHGAPGPRRDGGSDGGRISRGTDRDPGGGGADPGDSGGGGGDGPGGPSGSSYPPHRGDKKMDRDAFEFVETAMGTKGQVSKNNYHITKPGDIKDIATALWKKEGVDYDSRNSAAGRKKLAEIATKATVSLTSFGASKALTKGEMDQYELDVTAVSNVVRDGDLVVKSRGIMTLFVSGPNPCSSFLSRRFDDGVNEGQFPPHTPGAGFGMTPYTRQGRQGGSHYQLQRQAFSEPTDRHDPAITRRQTQGIKHDNRLVDNVTDKRRHFMAAFDPDAYPFECAMESPPRQVECVLAWELIASLYPKYLLEDIVYLDVEAAMDKTATAVYNDDRAHKSAMQMEFMEIRLTLGMNFEKGVKELFTKVEEVEAMNVMIITDLPADQVDNRKKEVLYCYLQENNDFRDVIKDYRNYQYNYESMFDQYVTCQHDLDVPRTTNDGRGRDTTRLAVVADDVERSRERDESPPESGLRASKQERAETLEIGCGPYARN